MATHIETLSRLMKLSWDIQRRKRMTRSKSLAQAWAIVNNADLTVWYLLKKLNHNKQVKYKVREQFTLFNS